jgi:hypothetical protein
MAFVCFLKRFFDPAQPLSTSKSQLSALLLRGRRTAHCSKTRMLRGFPGGRPAFRQDFLLGALLVLFPLSQKNPQL